MHENLGSPASGRLWRIATGVFVGIYVLGAAVWLYFAFFRSSAVPSAADTSFVPFVRWFFHSVVVDAPGAWAFAVALGELGLGGLILVKKYRPAGLLLATLWQVFGAGVADGWPLGLVNVALAAAQFALFLHQSRRGAPAVRRRAA